MIRVSGTSDSDRVFTAIGLTPGVIYAFQVAAVGSEFNSRGPFTSSLFVETERRCLITVGIHDLTCHSYFSNLLGGEASRIDQFACLFVCLFV